MINNINVKVLYILTLVVVKISSKDINYGIIFPYYIQRFTCLLTLIIKLILENESIGKERWVIDFNCTECEAKHLVT